MLLYLAFSPSWHRNPRPGCIWTSRPFNCKNFPYSKKLFIRYRFALICFMLNVFINQINVFCKLVRKIVLVISIVLARVNRTVDGRFPRFNKNRPVNQSNRPVCWWVKILGTVWRCEPDRFMYRAGPVPPETGRTRIVPTGFANPGPSHMHLFLKHRAIQQLSNWKR
jgi:hypothetical protein